MFHSIVRELLHILEHAGSFAYLILFFIAFFERAAFTGVILPGGYIVILAGFLIAHGYLHAPQCVAVIVFSATAGDSLGYLLGNKFGRSYFQNHKRFLLITRHHVDLAEQYFKDQGGKTILTGRFVSVLHMVVPFVSGMSEMRFKCFLVFDAMGNIGWALLFTGIGYFIGRTALRKGGWLLALGLFFMVILGMIVVSYYLGRKYKGRA